MPNENVTSHYTEVAKNILQSLADDAVIERSMCELCEEPPLTASEARFLYAQEAIASLPHGAVAASRGCGDPIAKAQLQPGERVLDLGSGGGIDALIAARLVGENGYVYGVDMTPEMVELATRNATDAGIGNVTFLHGAIENLPLQDESVDVVLSNCVINFSSDKLAVMRGACRVLAPGGRFVVSDIVSYAPISPESYGPLCRIVGTTNGMQDADDYRAMMLKAGFNNVTLERKTDYTLAVLEAKARQKDRLDAFEAIAGDAAIGGASGSVIITAYKPTLGID